MAWNCPKCRKTNSDEITVCDCGHVREIPTAEETEKKMVTCANCNQKTPLMDKYCINCGKEISLVPSQFNTEINRAAKWIMIIGILFIIFGTYFGFQHKAEADQAKTMISHLSDSDTLNVPINGKNYTVGELKEKIDQEVRLVFITNYFLAFAMIGLYFWARRAPFPAMVTALCLYLAVIVLNAILEPATLLKGIIIKVVFITIMISGIKSALEHRNTSTVVEEATRD